MPRDRTRKPVTAPIPEKTRNRPILFVRREKPKHGTHWSTSELSGRFGISHTAIDTILREHCLKPHPVKRFKSGTDVDFDAKLAKVVGLYLAPPENPTVFCVDEKTQILPLERTQPILPMRPRPRKADVRLRAARNHDAVCRAERGRWHRDR